MFSYAPHIPIARRACREKGTSVAITAFLPAQKLYHLLNQRPTIMNSATHLSYASLCLSNPLVD